MPPTGGGAAYPGVIDGMYWNRDIVAAEFGMHSGTRCAFKHRKPVFVGEFGTWYAGYPDAIKYRADALDDQLGVFDSAEVHWAVWTKKHLPPATSHITPAPDTSHLTPHTSHLTPDT